jgi:hypothetical protein
MQEHDKVTDYLLTVTQRLKADGFSITENITYRNQLFNYVAKRRRFQLEYSGFAEFLFIFSRFSTIDIGSLRDFYKVCYKYAWRSKIIPLPFVYFDYAFCFPVAIVDELDAATEDKARGQDPPVLYFGYEMPVIYNLSTNQLCYSEKNPFRGRLFHDHFRTIVRNMLSP